LSFLSAHPFEGLQSRGTVSAVKSKGPADSGASQRHLAHKWRWHSWRPGRQSGRPIICAGSNQLRLCGRRTLGNWLRLRTRGTAHDLPGVLLFGAERRLTIPARKYNHVFRPITAMCCPQMILWQADVFANRRDRAKKCSLEFDSRLRRATWASPGN
jgi:hypothetical protein